MSDRSLYARTLARLIFAPVVVFGAVVAYEGFRSHGAGFDGGIIAALGAVLVFLAGGRALAARIGGAGRARFFLGFCLAVAVILTGWHALSPAGFTAGYMAALNMLVCLIAALGLSSVFAVLCAEPVPGECSND